MADTDTPQTKCSPSRRTLCRRCRRRASTAAPAGGSVHTAAAAAAGGRREGAVCNGGGGGGIPMRHPTPALPPAFPSAASPHPAAAGGRWGRMRVLAVEAAAPAGEPAGEPAAGAAASAGANAARRCRRGGSGIPVKATAARGGRRH